MPAASPLAAYLHAVATQGFHEDPAQRQAAEALEACFNALNGQATAINGVYLWGPVGRGKTWLMDAFYQSLRASAQPIPARRQHFHHFMSWVHQRLFQLTGTADPLKALARELSTEVRVLCFDELFVGDIGDAIILSNLFRVMFDCGVVVVATSNQPPEDLYADGFNRERFFPAIAAIEQHMQVVNVDGGQDHRQHPGKRQQRYWLRESGTQSAMPELFAKLSDGQTGSAEQLIIGNRTLSLVQRCESVLWCRFSDLCMQPLAAPDFIALCDQFSTIILNEVPNLSASQRKAKIARGTEDAPVKVDAGDRQLPALSVHDDSVRRFIALVDECYDRKVPLYIEAAVALTELYTEGYLAFAFRRTLSRLQEMQLQRFGQVGEAQDNIAAPAPTAEAVE
ncbi:cell division protein ZapE [Pseudomonas sp.]|uniref:cell division protein ZapE n=1 Tax=Pseudomonas sp. TaxID=306 RepID=UPI00257F1A1D|nr:cell division protein ZapE [Pseudomonas sp.]